MIAFAGPDTLAARVVPVCNAQSAMTQLDGALAYAMLAARTFPQLGEAYTNHGEALQKAACRLWRPGATDNLLVLPIIGSGQWVLLVRNAQPQGGHATLRVYHPEWLEDKLPPGLRVDDERLPVFATVNTVAELAERLRQSCLAVAAA